jgi:hypothetical protein
MIKNYESEPIYSVYPILDIDSPNNTCDSKDEKSIYLYKWPGL